MSEDSCKKHFCRSSKCHPAGNRSEEKFETPRLFLRELTFDDAANIHRIANTPGFKFHHFGTSIESVNKFIQKCIDSNNIDPATGRRNNIMLAVDLKQTGELIGFTSLERITYSDGTVVMEPNVFIDPAIQNNGFGLEAGVNIVHHAFKNLGYEELYATVEKTNAPSLAIAKKAGYRPTEKEMSFNTAQGPTTYQVLVLDKESFYAARKLDKMPTILGASSHSCSNPKCKNG